MVLVTVLSSKNGREMASEVEIEEHQKVSTLKLLLSKRLSLDASRQRLTVKASNHTTIENIESNRKQKQQQQQQQQQLMKDDDDIAKYVNLSLLEHGKEEINNENEHQHQQQQQQHHQVLVVYLKDLGPQVSWKAVFMVEYVGPMVIYPLFYFFSNHSPDPFSATIQQVAMICWVLHYLKREIETILIHTFSRATMPLFNLFKNTAYYWGNTITIAYFVNSSTFVAPRQQLVVIGLLLFVIGELGNFQCHKMLAEQRAAARGRDRVIPVGFLFDLVTCPNYSFEILSWIAFSILTSSFAAALFAIMGAVQMYFWAIEKHKKLCVAYNGTNGTINYRNLNRKLLIPYLL